MIHDAVGPGPIDDLREHDREVLEFLSREPDSTVGFQGIRRRLGLHPEKLSRALVRLARDDLVQRTELGYQVTAKAVALLSPSGLAARRPAVPILTTYLPATADLRGLVAALKGKWVGPLRWYGLREAPEGLRLTWITADDALQVEAWFRDGALAIVAEMESPQRFDEATYLAHLLFHQIHREMSRGGVSALTS